MTYVCHVDGGATTRQCSHRIRSTAIANRRPCSAEVLSPVDGVVAAEAEPAFRICPSQSPSHRRLWRLVPQSLQHTLKDGQVCNQAAASTAMSKLEVTGISRRHALRPPRASQRGEGHDLQAEPIDQPRTNDMPAVTAADGCSAQHAAFPILVG